VSWNITLALASCSTDSTLMLSENNTIARRFGQLPCLGGGFGLITKVVAQRCGCNAGFAHGVTDLIQPHDHVAGGEEIGDTGALLGVHPDAPVVG
jgi:hypothetical protein